MVLWYVFYIFTNIDLEVQEILSRCIFLLSVLTESDLGLGVVCHKTGAFSHNIIDKNNNRDTKLTVHNNLV